MLAKIGLYAYKLEENFFLEILPNCNFYDDCVNSVLHVYRPITPFSNAKDPEDVLVIFRDRYYINNLNNSVSWTLHTMTHVKIAWYLCVCIRRNKYTCCALNDDLGVPKGLCVCAWSQYKKRKKMTKLSYCFGFDFVCNLSCCQWL